MVRIFICNDSFFYFKFERVFDFKYFYLWGEIVKKNVQYIEEEESIGNIGWYLLEG